MKKIYIFRVLTVSMAMLLLLAGTGVSLVEHYCMMRGKSISLFQHHNTENSGDHKQKRGCGGCKVHAKKADDLKTPIIKKTACCLEKQQLKQIQVLSSFSQLLNSLLKVFSEAIPLSFLDFQSWTIDWIQNQVGESTDNFYTNHKFYGKKLLIVIQVFRI